MPTVGRDVKLTAVAAGLSDKVEENDGITDLELRSRPNRDRDDFAATPKEELGIPPPPRSRMRH